MKILDEEIEFLTDDKVADMIEDCKTIEDVKVILMILFLSEPRGSYNQRLKDMKNRFI